MNKLKSGVSRRGFIVGALGTGFTLAFMPGTVRSAAPAAALANKQFEPTVWYSIEADGSVVVNVAEAEMGQHIGTALARIVADELEANWDHVKLNYVDTDPRYGYLVTGGSWSIWQNYDLLSQAGAAGRKVLLEEGARLLDVSVHKCKASNSIVKSGTAMISYADIVRKGDLTRTFSEAELSAMPIKKPSDHKLIGGNFQALDIPSKTRGKAVYGIDAEVPGMVYAKPVLPPTRYGSRVISVDDSKAKVVKGYQQTLILEDPSDTVPGWALVIADSYHAALAAEKQITISYEKGPTHQVSEADIQAHAVQLLDTDKGSLLVEDEGVDAAFAQAEKIIEHTYTTSTVLHFQMEPVNALALQKDGKWELHTGNQWQSLALPTYAAALGVLAEQIVMKTYLLGGGFGRRLNGDYGVPALLATKALNKPVKVVLSREDDARFDSPRSASTQKLSMAFNRRGKVQAMQHHAVAGWPTEVMAPFFMGTGANGEKFDPFSINGANHWYSVGAHRVRAVSNDLANKTFRPGWLRSVGPGWTNWALESFVDEVAFERGVDPILFRLSLLKSRGRNAGTAPNSIGGADRLVKVLKRVREKSGWADPLPKDVGLGCAITFGQERDMPTWTACVARVKVDRNTGQVELQKLTLVLDAGIIVHPDGALAQTEGAALWGASMALHEGTEFENGEVVDRNLNSYTPLRMVDVPELDIEFMQSNYHSVGLGEPGTTVVGPAIGNAIFRAVGARVRHLPIRPDMVKSALV